MFKQNPDVDIDVMRFRLGGGTRYFSSNFFAGGISAISLTTNYLFLIPFFTPVSISIDRIAINVTVAGAAGKKARLGIYEDDGKVYPRKLLLDAGEVFVDTTGLKEITINETLRGGKLYWLAIVTDGAPTLRIASYASCLSIFFGLDSTLGTSWSLLYWKSFTYAVLPDPFPSGASAVYSDSHVVFIRKA